MPAILWDEKTMGTGVDTIDKQHEELIKMINEMMDASSKGKGKEELGKMMAFLGDYAKKHFAHEEGVMDKHHCPVSAANKDAHAKFLQEFTKLTAQYEKEGPTLGFVMQVQQKVIGWLTNHIRGCDAQLKKCMLVGAK
ncbi:MAG: hemerythrin family protein [Planctomycetes bacterium]|nr:hemerythrin family protein [Planctomycetota bacterium]